MSGFSWRFVKRDGVACLETAQLSGLGFPFLKTPLCLLHCDTRGHPNELRGLEFGAEAKDSGAVKIILNSCEWNPANVLRLDDGWYVADGKRDILLPPML